MENPQQSEVPAAGPSTNPPAGTSDTARWLMYSMGILFLMVGIGEYFCGIKDAWPMILIAFSTLMMGRRSKSPEITLEIGLGVFLLTVLLCAVPFLYMMIFTDHDTPYEGKLTGFFFLWFCLGPFLIHWRRIHSPAVQSKKT